MILLYKNSLDSWDVHRKIWHVLQLEIDLQKKKEKATAVQNFSLTIAARCSSFICLQVMASSQSCECKDNNLKCGKGRKKFSFLSILSKADKQRICLKNMSEEGGGSQQQYQRSSHAASSSLCSVFNIFTFATFVVVFSVVFKFLSQYLSEAKNLVNQWNLPLATYFA